MESYSLTTVSSKEVAVKRTRTSTSSPTSGTRAPLGRNSIEACMWGGSANSRCLPSMVYGERTNPAASRPPFATRAARIARGGLDAAGFVRSPYTVDGKARLFAEPPHMQASMLFLSHGAQVPDVGDEVNVRVRFTATAFDETVISE